MKKNELEFLKVAPGEIEKKSFEIITAEAGSRIPTDERAPIIKRCIHTSADFDYAENLCFSPGVVAQAQAALKAGALVVTDTQMARAGINKKKLAALGGEVCCFIAAPEVAEKARLEGTTRSQAAVDRALFLAGERPLIFAVGNAPTALMRLYQLIVKQQLRPALIVGVPVGFVNVIPAKEQIMRTDIPYIVARGRKGGSNIAACIINALLYEI